MIEMTNAHTDFCCDEGKVNKIKPLISDVKDVELIFKALADPTRLKIAYALTLTEELCVADIARIIDSSTSTYSHNLRFLFDLKYDRYIIDGKFVFFVLLIR